MSLVCSAVLSLSLVSGVLLVVYIFHFHSHLCLALGFQTGVSEVSFVQRCVRSNRAVCQFLTFSGEAKGFEQALVLLMVEEDKVVLLGHSVFNLDCW